MKRLADWTKRVWQDQTGVTLMETIIGVGLISMCIAMVAMPMFSVIRANDDWRSGMSATANLRQAAGYVTRDAANASTASIDASDSVLLLAWSGNTVTYDIDGTHFRRTRDDGDSIVTSVAGRQVESVQFALDGELLTMTMVVQAGGSTRSMDSYAALRGLE
ncbi:MAG: hypothetical protein WD533_08745 [Dehalococcoidia bacterium]